MTNIVINDPYAPGGLRVWDDYQFRRKGVKGGGGTVGPIGPVIPPGTFAPVNMVLPDISGPETQAQSLLCSEGEWTGTSPISYEYQWYRVVEETLPANTSLPVISGTQTQGQTLSCTHGVWNGTTPITYEYQWFRVV